MHSHLQRTPKSRKAILAWGTFMLTAGAGSLVADPAAGARRNAVEACELEPRGQAHCRGNGHVWRTAGRVAAHDLKAACTQSLPSGGGHAYRLVWPQQRPPKPRPAHRTCSCRRSRRARLRGTCGSPPGCRLAPICSCHRKACSARRRGPGGTGCRTPCSSRRGRKLPECGFMCVGVCAAV